MRRASRGRRERPFSVSEVAGIAGLIEVMAGWAGGGVSVLAGRGSDEGPSEVVPLGSAISEYRRFLSAQMGGLIYSSDATTASAACTPTAVWL